MWKRILSVAHRAGFTRNETAVLIFLGAALLVGATVRTFRGDTSPPPEDVRAALQRQDSLFAAAATSAPVAEESQAAVPAGAPLPAAGGSGNNENPQPSAAGVRSVDINTADAATLERLPGIGPSTARNIIEHRTRSGRFARAEDLLEVKGIGPKKFDRLRNFIIVK